MKMSWKCLLLFLFFTSTTRQTHVTCKRRHFHMIMQQGNKQKREKWNKFHCLLAFLFVKYPPPQQSKWLLPAPERLLLCSARITTPHIPYLGYLYSHHMLCSFFVHVSMQINQLMLLIQLQNNWLLNFHLNPLQPHPPTRHIHNSI